MMRAMEAWFHGGRRKSAVISAILLAILLILLLLNLDHLTAGIQEIGTYLQYTFIRRALIVGTLVALCAALLGVILILKHYSMIGDGLSHMGFGSLTVAVCLGTVTAESLPAALPEGFRTAVANLCAGISEQPMVFTLIVVVICATLLLRISRNSKINGDSAIAIISTSALALGVIVTSTVSGMNIDVYNYMFGSILAMSRSDVYFSLVLSAVVLTLFIALYPKIFAVTFDEDFARATGVNVGFYNLMIAVLTAVTIVVGMRIMGTMLISGLIVFPALSAMRLFSRFRQVIISSAIISVCCFVVGIMLSCLFSLPTGAGIVAVNLAFYLICTLIDAIRH